MKKAEYRKLLELSLDLEYLRTRLVPGLDLGTSESWGRNREDLRELTALHGAKLRICRKHRNKLVEGFYDDILHQVTVIADHPVRNEITAVCTLYTYTHELAHAIQYQTIKLVPYQQQVAFFGRFHNALRLEQIAESLAYYIALNYFPSLVKKFSVHQEEYRTYFEKEDVLFIASRDEFDPESEEVLKELKALNVL